MKSSPALMIILVSCLLGFGSLSEDPSNATSNIANESISLHESDFGKSASVKSRNIVVRVGRKARLHSGPIRRKKNRLELLKTAKRNSFHNSEKQKTSIDARIVQATTTPQWNTNTKRSHSNEMFWILIAVASLMAIGALMYSFRNSLILE